MEPGACLFDRPPMRAVFLWLDPGCDGFAVAPRMTRGKTVRRGAQDDERQTVTKYRLAVIGGDGIGPEVTAEAVKAIRATGVEFDAEEFELGAERYKKDGQVLPDETLETLKGFDAILLGAVGASPTDKAVPSGIIERGLLLRTRFELDHYVNLRPFQTNKGKYGAPVDLVFVREGTEGPYVGEGGALRKGTPNEVATQGSVNTRFGVERVVRYAFELAQSRPKRHLTMVHKTNVLTFAGDLWQRTFTEVAAEYPDVRTAYSHVDAACIHLVDAPEKYDVIVTDNLFGDILTDLAGAIAGGIGLAASGNVNPDRTYPSMFEPVHGSAPDIAGSGKANPLAAIRSAAMMLTFLGETEAAARIEKAVTTVADDSQLSQGTTAELGDRVAERV
jgi:3-isopropylmalate dehydrogenase